jgi:hypothetical protein
MTQPYRQPSSEDKSKAARPSTPAAAFTAQAAMRAELWACGKLTLHEAVDGAWATAVRSGLVGALGTDAVQQLMAAAFGPVRAGQGEDAP